MKKNYSQIFILTILIVLNISCSNDDDAKIISIDQFSNTGRVLKLDYFIS